MTALKKFRKSLLYPALVVGSYMATMRPVLAQDQEAEGTIGEGVNSVRPNEAETDLSGIIENIINAMLFIVGIASVIMLIIGGIRYVVSAGDQNAVTGAKNTILYAIVGIIISFLAFALVNFVINRLGGDANEGASVFMLMNAFAV